MIRLGGCRPTSVSSYMAGMGVFRLVARQRDSGVRAFWERDRLCLDTKISDEEVVGFLLHEYEPSPVIGPWSLTKYQKSVVHAEPIAGQRRMRRYMEAVEATGRVLQLFGEQEGLDTVTKDDITGPAKTRFVRMCRNMWPDDAVEWLDAAAVPVYDKLSFNPLFGSGGNDGNLDMPDNFVQQLCTVFGDADASRGWLDAALFGADTALKRMNAAGHDVHGSGRPNSGSGGGDMINPWEHILMMEGMLVFAGGISRRTISHTGRGAFPFVVDVTQAYATAADEKGRGEIWLPVWAGPASYGEVRLALREGRAHYGGMDAKTGADLALAAKSMGVERGIGRFGRFGVLERKGNNHISVSLGTILVGDVPEAGPVADIMPWYARALRFAKSKHAPQSLKDAVRQLEGCIMELCRSPGTQSVQALLAAFGRLEAVISGRTWPGGSNMRPFGGTLSPEWLDAADDGSAEFRLAAAAASVRGAGDVGPIRVNLECVDRREGRWTAAPGSASCVWRKGSTLADNLGRICMRRAIEGKAAKSATLPLDGSVCAGMDDVEAFLAGVLDERKIADLMLPLSMVRWNVHDGSDMPERGGAYVPLPAAYALAKSVYGTPGVPVDLAPLRLLGASRTGDALDMMRRRARASGMMNGIGAVVGEPPACVAERLLGSLVFPVGREDMKMLLDAAALRRPQNA